MFDFFFEFFFFFLFLVLVRTSRSELDDEARGKYLSKPFAKRLQYPLVRDVSEIGFHTDIPRVAGRALFLRYERHGIFEIYPSPLNEKSREKIAKDRGGVTRADGEKNIYIH